MGKSFFYILAQTLESFSPYLTNITQLIIGDDHTKWFMWSPFKIVTAVIKFPQSLDFKPHIIGSDLNSLPVPN